MNMWNIKDLEPPVTNTCKIEANNIDLKRYASTFIEADNLLSNQSHLEAEAALLSRSIYRLKQKFRSDKGLKEMQKMNSALLRYLNFDLAKIVSDFRLSLPKKRDKSAYYPTLNMLDYLLVRTQGAAKLMCRTADCARSAVFYMEARISIGHLWKVAIIALAIAARIFVLAKELVRGCCTLYSGLLGLRDQLKNPSGMWIVDGYTFPGKLEEWLGESWSELKDVSFKDTTINVDSKLMRFCTRDDSDVEFGGEYIQIETDVEMIDEYVDLRDDEIPRKLNSAVPEIFIKDDFRINDSDDDILCDVVERPTVQLNQTRKRRATEKIHKNRRIQTVCESSKIVIQSDEDVSSSDKPTENIISDCEDNVTEVINAPSKSTTQESSQEQIIFQSNEDNSIKNPRTCEKYCDDEDIGEVISTLEKHSEFSKNKKPFDSQSNIDNLCVNDKFTKNPISDIGEIITTPLESRKRRGIQKYDEVVTKTSKPHDKQTRKRGIKQLSHKKSLANTIRRIKSIGDLKGFMKVEDKRRSSDGEQCKLAHLDGMQWNMLRNLVTSLVSKAKKVKDRSKSLTYLEEGKKALLMNVT